MPKQPAVDSKETPSLERPLEVAVSDCANCNKKYEKDGAKLCPQCRQV